VSGIPFRDPERYPHGTRARYVAAKCRCDLCRAANTAYYHQRQAVAKAAAAEVAPVAGEAPQIWTAPDGTKRERWYKRACPGPGGGVPCPRGAHLRKDSTGGVCSTCRELLVWNGNVWAGEVRAHLRKLSRLGVGYKSVAAACDVPTSILAAVLSGQKKYVRKRTADRVLAVTKDAAADHACIDAGPTRRLVQEMIERAGLTRGEIAQRLRCERPALQIGRGPHAKVLARTALAVRKLHAEVMAEVGLEEALPTICPDCGFSHAAEDRRSYLDRALPAAVDELREAHPCWWEGANGAARLSRDLRAVGAVKVDGVWTREPRARQELESVEAPAA
jgi:hypothetical protein